MKQRIKIVLQGPIESFTNYEIRLEKEINDILKTLQEHDMVIPFPTSASDGRLNTILTWREKEIDVQKK